MKLEHFRYLLEVNRLHSISAAARSLHIRQTTLSAMVKSAEEELGFPIFQRSPTGVFPTPMGEQFMALAWEINVKCEELFSLKQRTIDGSQAITLLLSPAILPSLPIYLTRSYHKFEVRGNLSFHECLSKEICQRLIKNAANIGVTYLPEQHLLRFQKEAAKNRIMVEPLLMDQSYLLVSKEHPFSKLEQVPTQAILEQRLATTKSIQDDTVLGRFALLFPKVTVFADVSLIMRAVLEQSMVAFLPKYTILSTIHDDLAPYHVIPIEDTDWKNRLYLCLIYRQESELRYQEKILTTCIREHFYDFLGYHPECAIHPEGGESV